MDSSLLRESERIVYNPPKIEALLSGISPDQRDVLWRLYRASRSRMSAQDRAMKAELIGLFKDAAADIERDIGNTFAKIGTPQWDLNAVRRIGYDRVLFGQIEDRIRALGGDIKSSFDAGLLDRYKTAYVDAAHRLDVLTPASSTIQFGLVPDREIVAMLAEPWSGARFSDRLGLISDEMASNIKHTLIRSMMAQESWQDAARRIRDNMGTVGQKSVWRAEMVARTELAHAQEMANSKVYEDNSDVIQRVVWMAHPGACEVCVSKHGKDVEDVGVPPGDSHPNCQCDQFAIPESWGELEKPGDGDFSIRPASRKTWAEMRGLDMGD